MGNRRASIHSAGRWFGLRLCNDGRVNEANREARSIKNCVTPLTIIAAIIFTTGGCMRVGPDFTKPAATMPDSWSAMKDARIKSAKATDNARWWSVFNDPVLDSLIETAFRENLDLQTSALRIFEARAQLGISVGKLFPQTQNLKLGYSYTQISANSSSAAPGARLFSQTYESGLDMSWELDFWGKYRRAIESADADLLAALAKYDDALVTLIGDTASAYVRIRTLEERLQAARENAELQERSLALAEVKFRNGAVTELDVQQARNLLCNTRSAIPALESSLRQAQNALSILLGMPPQDLKELMGGPKPIPIAPKEVVVGIPSEALLRRPDIQSAELQAASLCAQIGIARAELFPTITLTGSFGFLSSDSPYSRPGGSDFMDIFERRSFNMVSGPTIQWPVLNYGRIKNNVRIQDARFQEALITYRNTVLNAAREVEDSMIAFLRSQEQTAMLEDAVHAAKRAVYISTLQYQEGAVDYQRVIDSQQTLVGDQDQLAQAKGEVPLNLIALYKALGGGWQIRLGKDIVSPETIAAMRERTDWGSLLPPAGAAAIGGTAGK